MTLTAQGPARRRTLIALGRLEAAEALPALEAELKTSDRGMIDPTAKSAGGSGGIVNTGSAINTLTIVGGRIQNTIQNINATTRNVWFDRRFLQGGFAPPWFPATTVTASATDAITSIVTSIQRTQWLDLY